MAAAVGAVAGGRVPPEAEITAPDWYSLVDPRRASLDVRGETSARGGAYRCVLEVAPGSMPQRHARTSSRSPGGHCDGSERSGAFAGVVGTRRRRRAEAALPAERGRLHAAESRAWPGQSSNGRPNSDPYGFTLRLRVESAGELRGEDRRNLFLHRDADLLPGFPRSLPSDGEASPVFADLDGDNRNELIVATADGTVHAYRPDGGEAPGWPVRGERAAAAHGRRRAFQSGALSAGREPRRLPRLARGRRPRPRRRARGGGRRLRGPRVRLERGRHAALDDAAPGSTGRAGRCARSTRRARASATAPSAASSARRCSPTSTATRGSRSWPPRWTGTCTPGAPAARPRRASRRSWSTAPRWRRIDPATHQVTFNEQAGDSLMQGAIVDTPAVGDLTGDGRPEIVVGTNEEYAVDAPGEGGLNADNVEMRALEQAAGATGRARPGALARLRARRARRRARRLAGEDRQAHRRAAADRGRGHHRARR